MLTVDEAVPILGELLKEKRLIIFVGAGVSIASGLPTWGEFLGEFIDFCRDLPKGYAKIAEIEQLFSTELIKDAHEAKEVNPIHVATVLKSKILNLDTRLRESVEKDLKVWFFRRFSSAKPNPKHETIIKSKYSYILTSNYDECLEDADKTVGLNYSTYSFFQKEGIARAIYLGEPAIIHMHGKYSDIILDKIVLTKQDYARVIKKGEPGFSFAIQALLLRYSVLFVGYGSNDPHIEDISEELSYFFNYPRAGNLPNNYLVAPRPGPTSSGTLLKDYKKIMRTELICVEADDKNPSVIDRDVTRLLDGVRAYAAPSP